MSTSLRLPSPRVSFVDQIDSDRVQLLGFRSRPKRSDIDVLHVHHLDAIAPIRKTRGARRVGAALTFALRLRASRVPLVRTISGADDPTQGGRADQLANRIINAAASALVAVDSTLASQRGSKVTQIPFGHYRERFVGYPRSTVHTGRVMCTAAYLGGPVDPIIQAFADTRKPGLSLRVVGPANAARASDLKARLSPLVDRASALIEQPSDGALVLELSAAEILVLGQASELADVHLLFLALSLDRPVLVPRSPLTVAVAAAVGPGWVFVYDKPLSGADIDRAVTQARDTERQAQPMLEGRAHAATSAQYAAIFEAVSRAGRER